MVKKIFYSLLLTVCISLHIIAQTRLDSTSFNSPKVFNVLKAGVIPGDSSNSRAAINSTILKNALQNGNNTIIIPNEGRTYYFDSTIVINPGSSLKSVDIIGIANPTLKFKHASDSSGISISSYDSTLVTISNITIDMNYLNKHGITIRRANGIRLTDIKIWNCVDYSAIDKNGDGVHLEPIGEHCAIENVILDNISVWGVRDGFNLVIPQTSTPGPHFINECQFRNCEARNILRNPIRYELQGYSADDKISNINWLSFNSAVQFDYSNQIKVDNDYPSAIYVYMRQGSPSRAEYINYLGGVAEQGFPAAITDSLRSDFVKSNIAGAGYCWTIQNFWPAYYRPTVIGIDVPFVNFGKDGSAIRQWKDPTNLEIDAKEIKSKKLVQGKVSYNTISQSLWLRQGLADTFIISLDSIYPPDLDVLGAILEIEVIGNEYFDSDDYSYNYSAKLHTCRTSWSMTHHWSKSNADLKKGIYSNLLNANCWVDNATKKLYFTTFTNGAFALTGGNQRCYLLAKMTTIPY
jgi:hypothetical protein